MENSAPTGRILVKCDTSFSQKTVEKIQVSIKRDMNKEFFNPYPANVENMVSS